MLVHRRYLSDHLASEALFSRHRCTRGNLLRPRLRSPAPSWFPANGIMEYSRLPGLPIPASIRRRLPRLYYSQRPIAESEPRGNLRRGLVSSSEPHLPCHCQLPELLVKEARRPSTAGDALDSSESASSASESPQMGNSGGPAKYETDSGLKWNRVVPALNLLRDAGYEAQQPQAEGRLARSLYINAVMYLLDALPSDLTPEETLMLQYRIPEPVKNSLATCLGPSQTPLEGTGHLKPILPTRSYLHRLLASSIVQLFLLIRFILPYARLFLRRMYEYERSHRITERIFTTTLSAADGLGKSSVHIGSAVYKFNEGRVGAAVGNLTAWWIEGIAGGIYEGLGEGMMHLGLLKPEIELDGLSFQVEQR